METRMELCGCVLESFYRCYEPKARLLQGKDNEKTLGYLLKGSFIYSFVRASFGRNFLSAHGCECAFHPSNISLMRMACNTAREG